MGGIETIQTIPENCQVCELQAENSRLHALLQDALETVGIKPFGVPNRIHVYIYNIIIIYIYRIPPQAGGFWVFLAFFI